MGDHVLFLDRDGVINEHPRTPRTWDEFRFLPGVPEALAEATTDGWRIVVVTNKGIVGSRLLARKVSDEINRRMVEALAAQGAGVEAVYACNHFPHGLCRCRKPKAGLLEDAKRDLGLDPEVCWMVGDNATDVAAGKTAGCRTVLLTGSKPRTKLMAKLKSLGVEPDHWAVGLPEAWRDEIAPSARK